MTYGALYLASLSALLAQVGHSPDADRDEAVVLVGLCGCLLLVGAALLLIAQVSA